MLAVTLTVIVVAQNPGSDVCEPGLCGGTVMLSAFQQAVRRVLGSDARAQTQVVATAPADDEVTANAQDVDGVVELSFSPEGQRARLHCYLAREKRWLDREIAFGESHGSTRSEIGERGRLLGFAVATMYTGDSVETPTTNEPEPVQLPVVVAPARTPPQPPSVAPKDGNPPLPATHEPKRLAEFAASVSSGLGGTAAGLGATAGFRLGIAGPIWARLFVTGRTGNIPQAQASTRTALAGGGVALALLPEQSRFELGARLDAFVSYFDASHLSEDDVEPDRRSRWQLGSGLVAEGGWRATRGAGAFLGVGVEAILGETEVYTHHNRVAVVPPFRAIAELGFRTRF